MRGRLFSTPLVNKHLCCNFKNAELFLKHDNVAIDNLFKNSFLQHRSDSRLNVYLHNTCGNRGAKYFYELQENVISHAKIYGFCSGDFSIQNNGSRPSTSKD